MGYCLIMAITINGNGTIGGITAGGLPDGTVDTDVLAANAVTEAKLGSDEQKGLAKAWVNFNGTGTVAISSSFNVSSITDNGTGDYTVNFTTAMGNNNYAIAGTAEDSSNTEGYAFLGLPNPGSRTTTACPIKITRLNVGTVDSPAISVAIFGD